MEYEFNRLGYRFRYFFDADVDEFGHIDVEGYDVYEGEKLVAEINFISYEDIDEMTDEELLGVIDENLIDE